MRILRPLILLALVAGIVVFVFTPQSMAQRGYGMHHGMWGDGYSPDGGWSYCPYCGSRIRDRGGYERGSEYDTPYGRRGRGGYGMMGPGQDQRYGYSEQRRNPKPLKKEEALDLVEEMLSRSQNPNLKVGDIHNKEDLFVVEILTQEGSLVDRMEVDKETGMMRSEY